ncbi:hypothetical protein EalM132_00149 [Exiguobacterium phage vB_EalM-132]|nr:hypothetical protein EalM132_00149 [Exiguobacterium phage vB_EalM-132]
MRGHLLFHLWREKMELTLGNRLKGGLNVPKKPVRQNHTNTIEAFFTNRSAKSSNLYTDGQTLTNYYTVLAQHAEDGIIYNPTKYSNTTARIQHKVRTSIDLSKPLYLTSEDVPTGTSDLSEYVLERTAPDIIYLPIMGKELSLITILGSVYHGKVNHVTPTHVTLSLSKSDSVLNIRRDNVSSINVKEGAWSE